MKGSNSVICGSPVILMFDGMIEDFCGQGHCSGAANARQLGCLEACAVPLDNGITQDREMVTQNGARYQYYKPTCVRGELFCVLPSIEELGSTRLI